MRSGKTLIAAAIAAAVAAAMAGCAAGAVQEGRQAQPEASAAPSPKVTVQVAEGEVSPAERAELEEELGDRFGPGEFEVSALGERDGWICFTARKLPDGELYDMFRGDRWVVNPHAEDAAGAGEAEEPLDPGALSGQGQTGLSTPDAEFDVQKAWPLSMRDKVEPLIGEAAADGLLGAVNAELAASGASVADEVDVMVSEEGVEKDGTTTTFAAMAMCGNDRVVLACAYDAASGSVSVRRAQ